MNKSNWFQTINHSSIYHLFDKVYLNFVPNITNFISTQQTKTESLVHCTMLEAIVQRPQFHIGWIISPSSGACTEIKWNSWSHKSSSRYSQWKHTFFSIATALWYLIQQLQWVCASRVLGEFECFKIPGIRKLASRIQLSPVDKKQSYYQDSAPRIK